MHLLYDELPFQLSNHFANVLKSSSDVEKLFVQLNANFRTLIWSWEKPNYHLFTTLIVNLKRCFSAIFRSPSFLLWIQLIVYSLVVSSLTITFSSIVCIPSRNDAAEWNARERRTRNEQIKTNWQAYGIRITQRINKLRVNRQNRCKMRKMWKARRWQCCQLVLAMAMLSLCKTLDAHRIKWMQQKEN